MIGVWSLRSHKLSRRASLLRYFFCMVSMCSAPVCGDPYLRVPHVIVYAVEYAAEFRPGEFAAFVQAEALCRCSRFPGVFGDTVVTKFE